MHQSHFELNQMQVTISIISCKIGSATNGILCWSPFSTRNSILSPSNWLQLSNEAISSDLHFDFWKMILVAWRFVIFGQNIRINVHWMYARTVIASLFISIVSIFSRQQRHWLVGRCQFRRHFFSRSSSEEFQHRTPTTTHVSNGRNNGDVTIKCITYSFQCSTANIASGETSSFSIHFHSLRCNRKNLIRNRNIWWNVVSHASFAGKVNGKILILLCQTDGRVHLTDENLFN